MNKQMTYFLKCYNILMPVFLLISSFIFNCQSVNSYDESFQYQINVSTLAHLYEFVHPWESVNN
jgi:hypothetical protein